MSKGQSLEKHIKSLKLGGLTNTSESEDSNGESYSLESSYDSEIAAEYKNKVRDQNSRKLVNDFFKKSQEIIMHAHSNMASR